jgi:hypothetical protein
MSIEELARRYEPRVARALVEAWKQLQGLVSVGAVLDAMNQGAEAVLQLLASVRLPDDELRAALKPLVEAMAATATPAAAAFDLAWNLPDERGMGWVMRTADEMGWLNYNITPEGRDYLTTTLRQAFMEGGHPHTTARLIRGSIGLNAQQEAALARFGQGLTDQGISGGAWDRAVERMRNRYLKDRATTISRTETIRALRQGQNEAWAEATSNGLLEPDRTWREWVASSGACDEVCGPRDGTLIPYNGDWPDGAGSFPHPNCRCSEALVFDVEPDDSRIRKALIVKPFGRWADFDACVADMSRRLGSVEAARRYCGKVQSLVE